MTEYNVDPDEIICVSLLYLLRLQDRVRKLEAILKGTPDKGDEQ